MNIEIDIDSTTPIFAQLVEQIKQAVSTDVLLAGDALPSIRQLANDLDLNSKTIAKAYKLLERDNIIQSKGYRGSFIHPDAKLHCQNNIEIEILSSLAGCVNALRGSGATDSEIRLAFNKVLSNKLSTGE